MATDLEEKIQLLRKQYTFEDDKDRMSELLNKFDKAKLLKDLKNLDGIKMLLAEIEEEIKNITTLLAWDREQTEEQRKLLFQKRDDYKWFYSFFTSPTNIIKNIEAQINEEFNS